MQELTKLFTELKSGNTEVLNELLKVCTKYIHAVLSGMKITGADADDITQEVLIYIYEKHNTLRDPEAALSWIKRITSSRAIDFKRKQQRGAELIGEEGDYLYDTESLVAPMELPEDVMVNKERREALDDIIEKLPENQKIAFKAFYFGELKTREISETMQIPENTVKSHLKRARGFVQNEVLAYAKKYGVKLTSLAIIPVLGLMFNDKVEACPLSTAEAAASKALMHIQKKPVLNGVEKAHKLTQTSAGGAKAVTSSLAIKVAIAATSLAVVSAGTALALNIPKPVNIEVSEVSTVFETSSEAENIDDNKRIGEIFGGANGNKEAASVVGNKTSAVANRPVPPDSSKPSLKPSEVVADPEEDYILLEEDVNEPESEDIESEIKDSEMPSESLDPAPAKKDIQSFVNEGYRSIEIYIGNKDYYIDDSGNIYQNPSSGTPEYPIFTKEQDDNGTIWLILANNPENKVQYQNGMAVPD